jgi:AraC-like DNA-binding protein/copper chaperone CopZ
MKVEGFIIEEFKIKGMICSRCLKVLEIELKSIGVEVIEIALGKIKVSYPPEVIDSTKINQIIKANDFEILKDKYRFLAEQTKRWIINYIWETDQQEKLSTFLVEKLGKKYDSLSKNFSTIYGKTIERYKILLTIERTKELIEDDELSFHEMAFATGYQNLSALSRQFKRETGLTLKAYRKLDQSRRIPIDKI